MIEHTSTPQVHVAFTCYVTGLSGAMSYRAGTSPPMQIMYKLGPNWEMELDRASADDVLCWGSWSTAVYPGCTKCADEFYQMLLNTDFAGRHWGEVKLWARDNNAVQSGSLHLFRT